MQIITKGKQDYYKFLSVSNNAISIDEIYKVSSFLIKNETEEGVLLCNTLTGELVLISSEEQKLLTSLPAKFCPELTELIRHRFAIAAKYREDQSVEQIRTLIVKRREIKKVISQYTILPTTYCNARCFYCCESEIKHLQMTKEIADQLIDFIATHNGDRPVTLNWFGGEPTLGKIRIDQICQGLLEKNVEYTSAMISNAYLFDSDLVKHSKNLWKLKNIQITLDGTEDIYNKTKAYANVHDNPYKRVLRNIRLFSDEDIRVIIRLNLDNHNMENLNELIDEISECFKDRTNMMVYIHQLDIGAGFAPIEHTKEELDTLKQQLVDLQNRLEQKGWPQYIAPKLPSLRVSSCMADDPFSILCTPDGILSKCEDCIYNYTVGTLGDGIINQENIQWWRERKVFEDCLNCPLYPSCVYLLKNCPIKKERCTDNERMHFISRYKEIMVQEYNKWKAGRSESF